MTFLSWGICAEQGSPRPGCGRLGLLHPTADLYGRTMDLCGECHASLEDCNLEALVAAHGNWGPARAPGACACGCGLDFSRAERLREDDRPRAQGTWVPKPRRTDCAFSLIPGLRDPGCTCAGCYNDRAARGLDELGRRAGAP